MMRAGDAPAANQGLLKGLAKRRLTDLLLSPRLAGIFSYHRLCGNNAMFELASARRSGEHQGSDGGKPLCGVRKSRQLRWNLAS
jgi:hypothetical protein